MIVTPPSAAASASTLPVSLPAYLDFQGVAKALELDDVGRKYGVLVAPDKIRGFLDHEQGICVQNHRHILLSCCPDDLRNGSLHQRVPPKPWAHHEDMEPGKHVDDARRDLLGISIRF